MTVAYSGIVYGIRNLSEKNKLSSAFPGGKFLELFVSFRNGISIKKSIAH